MKRSISAFAIFVALAAGAQSPAPVPLAELRQVHALTNQQASHKLPVAFQATVLYFRNYEKTLFVQDGDTAIYVQATTNLPLLPGDRILVKGTTGESFRPFVMSSDITLLGHGALPAALPTTYGQLIRSERDCMWVTVRARIRAADMATSSGPQHVQLQLLTDGGSMDAVIDTTDSSPFKQLLDAEVEVTGAASGRFDGKMEQTGIELHLTGWSGVKVIHHASTDRESLPVTPMDQVLTGYHVQVESQRTRVHGTVSYHQPGTAIVLQDGPRSLWIQTYSLAPVRVGDVADVTGFPGLHDGFLTLINGEILNSGIHAPLTPTPATWAKLVSSKNAFDLVSIEGQVVTQVREAAQDEYVLMADGQMFSAIYRHQTPVPPMRRIEPGSRIRVTGICMLQDSNPFDAQVPFTILMRDFDDITLVAPPSLLSIKNLLILVSFLVLVVLAVGAKGWSLERKVARQKAALAARIEANAALEHHQAQVEQSRSRILEDINGSRPLAEVLQKIVELVSFRLIGTPCWCEIDGGAPVGAVPRAATSLHLIEEPIRGRAGGSLGCIFLGLDPQAQPSGLEAEALSVGANLAALAIETRRLYSDLLHRSEFDMLTDLHNRFSLEKLVDAQIEKARLADTVFGIIYIDLNEFKQVNDAFGHHVGDLYLREVAARMKRQLRSHDMMARLGGDEFAALVAIVPCRAGVEEIAHRLERSLDDPFTVEGYTLHGSASVGIAVYPDDGATRDSLISAADAAMYVAKHTRQRTASRPVERRSSAVPVERGK